MSIGSVFYQLLLAPLVLLLDVIFSFAFRRTANPGLAIVFLSLAVNLLVLPLYRRADAIQAEEQRISAALRPGVSHIRKVFNGDERFMMLQTYYRQNDYKPWYALKGSLSLLLEIPFFIAAYRFLSGLQMLRGTPFGPIHDLSAPDGLLFIAGHAVNLLPILMTAINLVSGAIYTKGYDLKSKLQLYGMALIFLVLLYDSPSGLVFYWTLNNLFSLGKNIVTRLKKPGRAVAILCSLAGVAFLVAAYHRIFGRLVALIAFCLLQLPLALWLLRNRLPKFKLTAPDKKNNTLFYLCCVMLTLLLGFLIPSAVIRSSPMEFVDIRNIQSPLKYVWISLLTAAGTFLVWFNVFFHLTAPGRRRLFSGIMLALTAIAIVDYMFFGKNYGTMSNVLQFHGGTSFTRNDILINLAVLTATCAALWAVLRYRSAILRTVLLAGCLAMAGMSIVNAASISKDFNVMSMADETGDLQQKAHFALDKSGRNVVVIMMDRALNGFVPYLIEEKPELKQKFAGFTYYSNTLSYGPKTNLGAPALYGGYDYTPERMDERSNEPLVEKHNEAIKVLPVLFLEHGAQVTVCDPTYAGYTWVPDLSIYDEYPEIARYITSGNFELEDFTDGGQAEALRERNFFCYSVFRASPVFAHNALYNNGLYNQTDSNGFGQQIYLSATTARGVDKTFIDPYAVLCNLSRITQIQDEGRDTFLMMSNDTTHEPDMLQEPAFVPAIHVDNTQYERDHAVRRAADGSELILSNTAEMIHYQSNMAALLKLGEWMDYLREQGVYDNTRIIIVADHGHELELFNLRFDEETCANAGQFYPLLMVKDFGAKEFSIDGTFMTNADTPTLATQGIIDDPVNPFTGNPICSDDKQAPEKHIAYSMNWNTKTNNGNTFSDVTWLGFSGDDIHDLDAWRIIGESLD